VLQRITIFCSPSHSLLGNNGLGAESVLQLSKHNPAKIYLGARDESRAERAMVSIKSSVPDAKIEFLPLDLASLKSVKQAADAFIASSTRLDVLMNNAGIMACPAGLTNEGYEIKFGTNHLGHALLTKLLLPVLGKTAETRNDVRIVNLGSSAHTWAPKAGLVLQDPKTEMKSYSTWARYGQSKLANIYYTRELARRYRAIKSVAIHPGSVGTNLVSGPIASYPYVGWLLRRLHPIMTVSVQKGALNQLWASVSPDAKSGHFYYPVAKDFPGSDLVRDDSKALELWEWTEAELKKHGY
jgi:NAD(P)-dependent dehydrogenase (short-subunit alcohol dehydrogenase family)